MNEQLNVRVISPEKVIWEGMAHSVSSKNVDGPFDVLPEHANFITIIYKEPIVIRSIDKKLITYTFDQSVLYTHNSDVRIYTTI